MYDFVFLCFLECRAYMGGMPCDLLIPNSDTLWVHIIGVENQIIILFQYLSHSCLSSLGMAWLCFLTQASGDTWAVKWLERMWVREHVAHFVLVFTQLFPLQHDPIWFLPLLGHHNLSYILDSDYGRSVKYLQLTASLQCWKTETSIVYQKWQIKIYSVFQELARLQGLLCVSTE